jgi:hypothetical protein
MGWTGIVARIGEMRMFVGKPEGDYLEDLGIRWKDNIKMYLKEVG